MSETAAKKLIGRFFYQRSLRIRVVLTQTPFFLTVVLAVVLTAFLHPSMLRDPQLLVGFWLTVALTAACFLIHWDNLPPASFLVIPYLDFVAVAFFREGIQGLLSSAGMLALFPVFWLCASGYAPKTAVVSSTLASLLIVWNPLFQSGQLSGEALMRPLLFPFMLLGFAIAVVVLTKSMDRHRLALLAKDGQLRSALMESQQRERLLETVLDTVGVGVVVLGADGHERLVNSAQESLHALATPKDISCPDESQLLVFNADGIPLPAETRPLHRAANGESFTNYQFRVGTGAKARVLSSTARPIPHGDDESDTGAVIAFNDVTDMANAMAAKDDLVANVSHELRTPVTAILSYLDMAMESPHACPPDVQRYLHIASRNADRLRGLTLDLLSTGGAIAVDRVPTDVAALVDECLSSAAPAAVSNSITTELRTTHPLMAQVDPVRISQVLDNLVSNAIKYSPDGGTLTVRLWTDGDSLRCEVSDTGLGMSADEQAEVFKKFFRAAVVRDRGIHGIGLGLMITRSIVEAHGGTMTLLSEPGTGTTIGFTIPAAVMELAPIESAPIELAANEDAHSDNETQIPLPAF